MAKNSTQNLLAAVDEGDLPTVKKLLKTVGVCVNGTNKVTIETWRLLRFPALAMVTV